MHVLNLCMIIVGTRVILTLKEIMFHLGKYLSATKFLAHVTHMCVYLIWHMA